jgi:hypothetical protein
MPMTRTQALRVASHRNATRLGSLLTGLPPVNLLDRREAEGEPAKPPAPANPLALPAPPVSQAAPPPEPPPALPEGERVP